MSQPIICFEGPSGIGKTTMGQLLSSEYNIVPEVNLLFERPENEPTHWYLEKQVERYNICQKSNTLSILDGDIFQPIWYNWVCNYPTAFLPKTATHTFYKEQLSAGKIQFPDLYIIFYVEEKELWSRKEKDLTRRRRNFEKHLKIIEPLQEYWLFLDRETELAVKFVHYLDVETVYLEVLAILENLQKCSIDEAKVFGQIERWLNKRNITI